MLNANNIARQDLVKADVVRQNFERAKDVYSRQNKEISDTDRASFLSLLDDMLKVELELQLLIRNLKDAKKEAQDISKVGMGFKILHLMFFI